MQSINLTAKRLQHRNSRFKVLNEPAIAAATETLHMFRIELPGGFQPIGKGGHWCGLRYETDSVVYDVKFIERKNINLDNCIDKQGNTYSRLVLSIYIETDLQHTSYGPNITAVNQDIVRHACLICQGSRSSLFSPVDLVVGPFSSKPKENEQKDVTTAKPA